LISGWTSHKLVELFLFWERLSLDGKISSFHSFFFFAFGTEIKQLLLMPDREGICAPNIQIWTGSKKTRRKKERSRLL